MQQMRGNINQQAIEQFLNGPECPFKYEEESEKIYNKVCEDNKTTGTYLANHSRRIQLQFGKIK